MLVPSFPRRRDPWQAYTGVVSLRIERRERLAVLRLDKPRGNAIDEELAEALGRAAAELAGDGAVQGVLLASAHPKLFCPGLDLFALADYDRSAMERFMRLFTQAVLSLYGLSKPMVAAVGGAAVAGGCILALTSDHRVLKRGAVIGLNEVKVGVPLPWAVTALLRASVPAPALARVALLGRNFSDEEAVSVGLADELRPAEGFEESCLSRLQEFAEKDAFALRTTKAWLREPTLREMRAHEDEHLARFLDGWFSPATQQRIRAALSVLQKR